MSKNQKINNDINNFNNDFNNFNDNFDDVRQPIPTITEKLIDDVNDNFEEFKRQIMSDNSIDKNLKEVIIKSRQEYIENFENKSKKNMERGFRSGLIVPLIIKIKSPEFKNIPEGQKSIILNNIDKWIDGYIQIVELYAEPMYQIYELIDNLKKSNKIIDSSKLKNIFIPKNYDEYIDLVNTMEIIKTQSIKEEEDRKIREHEKIRLLEEEVKKINELENIKILQIQLREDKLYVLKLNLNKISLIDLETKILKEHLDLPLKNYINLESEFIILDIEIANKFIKFLNSIRIKKEDKENLINLCKS